jgi:hypothetical protein
MRVLREEGVEDGHDDDDGYEADAEDNVEGVEDGHDDDDGYEADAEDNGTN